MSASPVILWFRDDLRLADQPAVHTAAETGQPVLPLYVLDDETPGRWRIGGASRWWLHHSLASLDRSLAELGPRLILRRGRAADIIPALVRETGAREVFTGCTAGPAARRSDHEIARALEGQGARLHHMRTTTLFPLGSIRTKSGGPYSVYTPFASACLAVGPGDSLPAPQRLNHVQPASKCSGPLFASRSTRPVNTGVSGQGQSALPAAPPIRSDALDDWALLPSGPDWAAGFRPIWTPGEAGAQEHAERFLAALDDYPVARERPGGDPTSMLSPHLHFGEISALSLWNRALETPPSKGRDIFVRELLWREFAANLLWDHPDLPDAPLRPAFRALPWREAPVELRAWQQGRTGVPIVDAGMRQLWQTGWMHNRVRMITASFLVKHLLVSWQAGEAWFWDTLVDADLASNAVNWQWVAGCGADASPFFRIFNPLLQGRKFDPEGAYVRRFVPELKDLPSRLIHAPWEAADATLARHGVVLGQTYPRPIVELAEGRARALQAFRHVRSAARGMQDADNAEA